MSKPASPLVAVRFTPELGSALSLYATERALSVSAVIRLAVVQLLDPASRPVPESANPVKAYSTIAEVEARIAASDTLPFSERVAHLVATKAILRGAHTALVSAANTDPTVMGEFKRLALVINNKKAAKVSKDDVKAEIKSREPVRAQESMGTYNMDEIGATHYLATPEELAHFNLPTSFNDVYGSPFTTDEDFQIRSDISWLRGYLKGNNLPPPVGESDLGMAHLIWEIEYLTAVAPEHPRLAQLKEFRDTGTYTQPT